jgi:hypothetical protein
MNELKDLLNDTFVDVPGCDYNLMMQQLNQTCRDFCIKTEAWIVELDPINVVESQTEYTLNPKCNAMIQRIIQVKYGTTATDDIDPLDAEKYELENDRTLVLDDSPDEAITDGLVVMVSLRPTFNDTIDLPEWFLDRYGDYLIAGTKGKLMKMQRKPWTNFELARHYDMEYAKGKACAIREKFAGFKNVSVEIERRSFI